MKKKLILVVAILIIVITAIALLVGCAPKNPTDYLKRFSKSNSKVVVKYDNNGIESCTAWSEKLIVLVNGTTINVFEKDGDKVIYYCGFFESYIRDGDIKVKWIEKNYDGFQGYFNGASDFSETVAYIENSFKEILILEKDLEEYFKKENGVYLGSGADYDGMIIKINKNEMSIKYDANDSIECDLKFIFNLKLELPADVKNLPLM